MVKSAQFGFVYAATGSIYVDLARRSARSLRQIHPDADIDLFTDRPLEDPVFSAVHQLSDSFFRPKMEALSRSRFEKTIYLDADTMVVGDVVSVFAALDQFDFAACLGRYQNNAYARLTHTQFMPDAFGVVNSGFIGLRKSPKTTALLEAWEAGVREMRAKRDQPALRELLYKSDLRICILPPGFNLLTFNELKTWWGGFGAPRVLHSAKLHSRRSGAGDPTKPFSMEELAGRRNARRVRALLHADLSITPNADLAARRLNGALEPELLRWARRWIAPIVRRITERRRSDGRRSGAAVAPEASSLYGMPVGDS